MLSGGLPFRVCLVKGWDILRAGFRGRVAQAWRARTTLGAPSFAARKVGPLTLLFSPSHQVRVYPRAELLAKTGAHAEARHAYEIAIGLERDASVRRFLHQRQSALAP